MANTNVMGQRWWRCGWKGLFAFLAFGLFVAASDFRSWA